MNPKRKHQIKAEYIRIVSELVVFQHVKHFLFNYSSMLEIRRLQEIFSKVVAGVGKTSRCRNLGYDKENDRDCIDTLMKKQTLSGQFICLTMQTYLKECKVILTILKKLPKIYIPKC